MYDDKNAEFKFSGLKRHLNCNRFTKGEVNEVQVYVPQNIHKIFHKIFCIKSQGHVSDENFLYYCS